MLKQVTLRLDPMHPEKLEHHQVEDFHAFMARQFGATLPAGVRIYHQHVAKSHDVTPEDESGIKRLETLPGPFFVVAFPGDPTVVIAQILFSAVLAGISMIMAPNPPTPVQRNQRQPSPNNELSDRTNRARINGRIADIFGTVRSTPDLIALPYKVFENGVEVEYAYMCVGRGSYEISDVRDGDTLCSKIPGTTVQVYAPFTSPNSGDAPELVIGQQRDIPVVRPVRSNSVNGQVLRPPNETSYQGANNIRFVYPNIVELTPGTPEKFTKSFVAGDVVDISAATITSGVGLSETLECIATYSDELRQKYKNQLGGGTYSYDTTGGALLFRVPKDVGLSGGPSAVLPLFVVGASITITQLSYKRPLAGSYPSAANINGTYEIASVEQTQYDTGDVGSPEWLQGEIQRNKEVPMYVIVRLVAPASENSDWATLKSGSDDLDYLNEVSTFKLQIAHAGAVVDYNADLAGTYSVLSVTDNILILDDPAAVNSDWDVLDANGGVSPYLSPLIETNGEGRWVGPFIVTDVDLEKILCNFVAQNGLYKDDGTDQEAVEVEIEIEAWPVDGNDEQIDDSETFRITLAGSPNLKETVAATLDARFASFFGRCAVRARRVTETDEAFDGLVVDEVRWRDLYSIAYIDQRDFGNVTTVQSVTFATASALAVKERRLNMLVSRKLPVYDSEAGTFDDENLAATDNAADILAAICRDRYIGNRSLAELDLANFYDTLAAVVEYFGHENAGKFSYTFDQSSVSFEETVNLVAQSIFCTPYRRGNVIRLSFERQTDNSTLLFNHRNKVPGTERRTFAFGRNGDHDGIEFTYVNPSDDSVISVFLPEGQVAVNPKRIESIGVRNHLQAYFHAWRAWNKMRFQHLATEFEALQEAELLLRNDRILVADNTRPGTQDGEVVDVDTLELTLSQPVDISEMEAPVVHLQHVDGTVENIGITAGEEDNLVVLDDAPSQPLAVDPEGAVRAGYIVVADDDPRPLAFLATEREPLTPMTHRVRAVNYDDRYYGNDLDYINEVITEDGYGPTGGFVPDGEREWPSVEPTPPDEVDPHFILFYRLSGSTFLSRSFDGIEWENEIPSGLSGVLLDVFAYSPSLKRIVGFNSSADAPQVGMYSDDYGETWSAIPSPLSGAGGVIHVMWVAALGRFVAQLGGGSSSQPAMHSTDGLTWTLGSHTGATFTPFGATRLGFELIGSSVFMLTSQQSGLSSDGQSWAMTNLTGSDVGSTPDSVLSKIAYSASLGRVVCGSGGVPRAAYSSASPWSAWSSGSGGSTAYGAPVAWSPDLAVFCRGHAASRTSSNGTSWTDGTSIGSSTDRQVFWDARTSMFISIGQISSVAAVATSANGASWTQRYTGAVSSLASAIVSII